MGSRPNETPVLSADKANQRLEIEFDITPVADERGDRLPARQAEALLDIVAWMCEQAATVGREHQGEGAGTSGTTRADRDAAGHRP
jgi:hypothetical protein